MELINKITVSTIGCQPKPHSIKHPKRLCTLMGIMRGVEIGSTSYGEYLKFSGSFEAHAIEDDKRYKAGRLILPNLIAPILQDALESNEGAEVEFALVVGVKPSPKGNTGYEYTIEPLTEMKETAAMEDLRARSEKALKALPAPKDNKPTPKK